MSSNPPDIELSARELLIAKRAAELAVKQMEQEFYQAVGKTVIQRFFIIVGAIAVGIAYGKGWLSFSSLLK